MPLNHNQLTAPNFINTQSPVSLSPIHRLCPDILTEIFTFCLPDGSRESTNAKYISSQRAPLLLCSVCSSWRFLAISTPHLWQTLCLSPILIKGLTIDTESFLNGIRFWLDRSKALPLTICFFFLGIQPHSDKALKCCQILQVLSQEVSRWGRFKLYSPEGLFISPHFGILPMLHVLDISNSHIRGIPLTSAPRLKRLKLFSLPEPTFISAIPWDQLVELTIVEFQTTSKIVEIIQHCPRLEWLSLGVVVKEADEVIWQTFKRTIKHNALRRLWLDQPYVGAVIDRLTLPALEHLSLNIHWPVPQVGISQLVDFFTRSDCQLQKLMLFQLEFEPGELLACLSHRSCRTLTFLVIQEYTFSPPMVDEEILIRLTYPDDDDDDVPLCPKLNHLKLYDCTGSDKLFHQLLGKMVHSRCFGRAEVDQLRSLKIYTEAVVFREDYELLISARNNSGLKFHYQHANDPNSNAVSGQDVDENMYEEDSDDADDSWV